MDFDDLFDKSKKILDKASDKFQEIKDSKEVNDLKQTVKHVANTTKEEALKWKDETTIKTLQSNKTYVKNIPGRFISGRGYNEIRYVKISINRKYVRYANQKIGIDEIDDVYLDNDNIHICTSHGTTQLQSNDGQIIVAAIQKAQAHLLRLKSALTMQNLKYEEYPINEDNPSDYEVS